MAAKSFRARRKSQRGMATIEVLPILVVFLMLIGYGLGFFGIVHSGILNSIAARAYAFETFRNRSNLTMFRDNFGSPSDIKNHFYGNFGNRLHAIESEEQVGKDDPNTVATSRPISFGREVERSNASVEVHNVRVLDIQKRNRVVETSPAWIMVGYGICLNAKCGDN